LPSISVVLPAYNEEKNVPKIVAEVVETLQEITQDYEVIVVNDGSKDRTADVTRELSLQNPRIRLVAHEVNRGYGAAVHSGFYAATKELVFLTDADNQFDVSEISKLLPHIGDADLAIGYRVHRQDPFIRKLNAFGWCWLVNLLFGYTARDVDCAFKLFKREILDNITIESRGATFSAEFLVRAKRKGYTILEVPVTHRPRIAGRQTGARLDVILRAFRELIRFHRSLSREKA